jgi:hypothetical protein
MDAEDTSPWINWPDAEADYSSASSAVVKNVADIIPLPPYIFIVLCLIS